MFPKCKWSIVHNWLICTIRICFSHSSFCGVTFLYLFRQGIYINYPYSIKISGRSWSTVLNKTGMIPDIFVRRENFRIRKHITGGQNYWGFREDFPKGTTQNWNFERINSQWVTEQEEKCSQEMEPRNKREYGMIKELEKIRTIGTVGVMMKYPWLWLPRRNIFKRKKNLDVQLESTLLILLHEAFWVAHAQMLVLPGTQVSTLR